MTTPVLVSVAGVAVLLLLPILCCHLSSAIDAPFDPFQQQPSPSTQVFQYGDAEYPCIRIPALLSIASEGVLIAFAECRKFHGDGCVFHSEEQQRLDKEPFGVERTICMRRSFDGGKTWTTRQDNITGTLCANPSPVYHPDLKTIFLQCDDTTHYPAPNFTVWQVQSRDFGATWSTATNVTASMGLQGYHLGTAGAGILKRHKPAAGRMLFVGYDAKAATVWYSDDNGTTYAPIAEPVPFCGEPQLIEDGGGMLILVCRNNDHVGCNCRRVATSTDGGISFTAPQPIYTLPDPACEGAAVYDDALDLICVSSPNSHTSRVNMTLFCSHDISSEFHALGGVDVHMGAAYSALARLSATSPHNATLGWLWETGAKGCVGPSCQIRYSTTTPPQIPQINSSGGAQP